MAVFTSVRREELVGFLRRYAAGELVSYRGIASGTANTNYFVTTGAGDYVLTLFESLDAAEIPFFLDLTRHLADHDLPCARPLRGIDGKALGSLHGRPAALVQRLPGASLEHPDHGHCAAVGAMLARLHLAAQDFPLSRHNPHGLDWAATLAADLVPRLDPDERELLDDELRHQRGLQLADLPRGLIHADLFRDNVLFLERDISGVIDFYFACHDHWLLDLAITVNDWCVDDDGVMDAGACSGLVEAYANLRPLTATERDAFPDLLRRAALRFWLSRLADRHRPRSGEIGASKDPAAFRRRLQLHRRDL